MFEFYAEKTQLKLRQQEPLTSGSAGVYPVRFEFSPDWEGLTRRAVFRCGQQGKPVAAPWTGDELCEIPWEVLAAPGRCVQAGVYGTDESGTVLLPTIWADCGYVEEGAAPGEESRPPTPELWQQELAGKGDKLGYTEAGELGLYAGDKLLSAVPVVGGGGGGTAWGVGHGLKVVGGDLTVSTVDDFKGDNTLPMTAAGVQTTVGNIEALLETI